MYEYLYPGKLVNYIKFKDGAEKPKSRERIIERYEVESDKVKTQVEIAEKKRLPFYRLITPNVGIATKALLNSIRERLLESLDLSTSEFLDPAVMGTLRRELTRDAEVMLASELPDIDSSLKDRLILNMCNDVFGLGNIQLLLDDNNIEEVVVNSIREPVRIYHKKYGWMQTNLYIESENDILNHAARIARSVGREITTLNPRLDAYLASGDRINATLNPISIKGHTITIRKFSRDPWTATDFINNKTINADALALVWMAVQYEMNIIISGGTVSGKTSFLNVCMPFIQPNHRIISIEDTRELQLPEFLYWCPMITREANPEGKGEVSMLDLLVNSLRMRPDRIIMGEIRKQKEAEVLFEAMHTGHSVYATLHADTCAQTISRLTNPPINIPHGMLDSVHLNVVMFRDRRNRFRRVFEVGEFAPVTSEKTDETRYVPKILYRWDPLQDALKPTAEEAGFYERIAACTGLSNEDIKSQIETKKSILSWAVKHNVRKIDDMGRLMNLYYTEYEDIVEAVKKDASPGNVLADKAEEQYE